MTAPAAQGGKAGPQAGGGAGDVDAAAEEQPMQGGRDRLGPARGLLLGLVLAALAWFGLFLLWRAPG